MIDRNAAADARILVTGAAGFVGYHACDALVRQGYEVVGIDNLNDYYDPTLKKARLANLERFRNFQFQVMDVADHARVDALFATQRPRFILHLAAQAGVRYSLENPRAYTTSNVDGFLSILEACRRHGADHLVFASSSSVYGANENAPFHESDAVDHPVSLYAATKRANELMAHTYAHLFGIPCTGLRFFTVYGPWGRPDMAYFLFTKRILQGIPIDVYDIDHVSRDFTYIDDIVEALVRLIEAPPSGPGAPSRLFNIGNQNPVGLRVFLETLEACLGHRAVINHKPLQPGDVRATHADTSALRAAIGYEPSTTLEVGLSRFVDWYRAYYP